MWRRYIFRWGWPLLRLYWFVVRPHPRGAKCIVSCGDKLLFVRNTYGRRQWTFPGGRIERGETPERAVRRELAEEVGLELTNLRLLGDFDVRKDFKVDHLYCFVAETAAFDLAVDEGEIEEAVWLDRASRPTGLSAVTRRMLAMLEEVEYSPPPADNRTKH